MKENDLRLQEIFQHRLSLLCPDSAEDEHFTSNPDCSLCSVESNTAYQKAVDSWAVQQGLKFHKPSPQESYRERLRRLRKEGGLTKATLNPL